MGQKNSWDKSDAACAWIVSRGESNPGQLHDQRTHTRSRPMQVLTILNHGTSNSTNVSTSDGFVLVITQLGRMMAGACGDTWILNEGAGTHELRVTGIQSGGVKGV